jgi:hypothetical protein
MASAEEKQARRELAKKSWAVVKENKYLLAFPVSGIVFALVPITIFGIPALLFLAAEPSAH